MTTWRQQLAAARRAGFAARLFRPDEITNEDGCHYKRKPHAAAWLRGFRDASKRIAAGTLKPTDALTHATVIDYMDAVYEEFNRPSPIFAALNREPETGGGPGPSYVKFNIRTNARYR